MLRVHPKKARRPESSALQFFSHRQRICNKCKCGSENLLLLAVIRPNVRFEAQVLLELQRLGTKAPKSLLCCQVIPWPHL